MSRPPGIGVSRLQTGVAFLTLVTLSSLQLFFQQLNSGDGDAIGANFLAIYLGNLVASSPWLPIALAILRGSERFPPNTLPRLSLHAVASVVTSLAFLAWLALFHSIVAPRAEELGPGEAFLFWWRQDIGEFFTVGLLIYWLVAAVGFAVSVKRGLALKHQQPALETTPDNTSETTTSNTVIAPLVVRSVGRSRLVDPKTIEWIEADGDYARLHTEDGSFLLRRSMKALAKELEDSGFVRVHRSTIVRLDRVVEVRPMSHGEAVLALRGGREVKVSRTYREALADLGL